MNEIIKNQQNSQDLRSVERKRYFLDTEMVIQMAKRLRIDLNKFEDFIKFNRRKQELWENPLVSFVAGLYEKRFGRYQK